MYKSDKTDNKKYILKKSKEAWIKRHKDDKNWNNKHSGIYYSRHLLWGKFPDLKKNVKELEKKDKVKITLDI